jgi:ketosteroid isomerase-like protein
MIAVRSKLRRKLKRYFSLIFTLNFFNIRRIGHDSVLKLRFKEQVHFRIFALIWTYFRRSRITFSIAIFLKPLANISHIFTKKVMRKYLIIIVMALSVQALAQNKPTFEGEALEVWNTIQKWNDAFEKNDVETYFSFIHPDLSLFIPQSPYRVDSKDVDIAEFKWSLQSGASKVSLFQELQPAVQVVGDLAFVTYHNRGVYGPEGQEAMAYLKETDILIKDKNQWKVIHIHVSK